MNKLQKKIREVQEEHAEEVLNNHLETHNEAERANAFILLGRIQATDRISATLSSEVIRALEQIQETRVYKSLGYDRFVDYLNDANMSPMTKNQFYAGKKLIDKEGDVLFDVYTTLGIPLAKRKLLGKGNVQVEAGKVIIKDGDEEISVEINDRTGLIEMLTVLADRKIVDTEIVEKKDEQIKKLETRVQRGEKEYDELRRSMDAMQDGSPYERALMSAVGAMIKLAVEANKLPLAVTQARGRGDVHALWNQMLIVREALQQPDFIFTEQNSTSGNSEKDELAAIAKQVFAEDDDFGDEYEQ